MRKTKIVCTLGPATEREGVLKELIMAGMNVARFNFSHASHDEHLGRLQELRRLSKECNKPVAALLDTKGPEIRIKEFKNGKVELVKDQTFTLTARDVLGDEQIVSITYKELINDVCMGSTILIDDGLIELTVTAITDTDIVCIVKNNGIVSNNKGVNVPNINLTMPFISKKDRDDIIFAVEAGFDFIAASFVRSAEDIRDIHKILKEYGNPPIHIIAKIENMQGVTNIDEIIEVADGIMIARGDMGVEIPYEEVPVIQKMIIKKAYSEGKPVITATQMLDSMMKNPRPTRAETTDVANAVYDGTSAIMLSGETAAGLYPVEALKTMAKIAVRTENDIDYKKRFHQRESNGTPSVTDAISRATVTTAHELDAKMIITVTQSGRTARMISKYRPSCPLISCTTDEMVYRQLCLTWGVTPLLTKLEHDTFELINNSVRAVEEAGLLSSGELTVVTAGVPLGVTGNTNLVKVHIAN